MEVKQIICNKEKKNCCLEASIVGRTVKCVLIWGQHLHVWQWLDEPACLTVGQFTAGWMDIGSVWSIKYQSDMCLAFFHWVQLSISASCLGNQSECTELGKHFFFIFVLILILSGTAELHLLKSDQTFSLHHVSAPGTLSMAAALNTSRYNLGFCSICKSSSLSLPHYTTRTPSRSRLGISRLRQSMLDLCQLLTIWLTPAWWQQVFSLDVGSK